MPSPVLFESHCHSPLCRHIGGEPEEYAQVALDKGMAGIAITCHGPTPIEWDHCIWQRDWDKYLGICERARNQFAGQIEVKTGIECDFVPSLVSYWRDFLQKQPMSHVLGSVHPQVPSYREQFWGGDAFEFQKTYFEHLADAAETGLFDTLSHPDIVKNFTPDDWDVERILPHIQRQLDRIAKTGIAMELNTSRPFGPTGELNPGPEILREMAARGIPVVIGSDAHTPSRVGDKWQEALDLLTQCGFKKISFFVDRTRRDVEIGVAKASLNDV